MLGRSFGETVEEEEAVHSVLLQPQAVVLVNLWWNLVSLTSKELSGGKGLWVYTVHCVQCTYLPNSNNNHNLNYVATLCKNIVPSQSWTAFAVHTYSNI